MATTGSTAVFSNNIVVNHTNGIRTNDTVTVTADHTLLFGNDRDLYQASGVLSSTNAIVGLAPAFIDPAGYDYHLMCGSPAIDAGADVGVDIDIDGDARPEGLGHDIGADEALTAGRCRYIYLPLVLR